MKWYENHPNYGASPPNAHAWVYHPQWGLLMSPQGGVHLQALKNRSEQGAWGLTTKPVFGRVYPNGSIGGSEGPYATWYSHSSESPHIDEAKQAVEQWLANYHAIQQIVNNKTASLPHKFVWANGQIAVGPGWRKDVHHMHLMQDLGLTEMPEQYIGGTYHEDPFTGQPSLSYDWGNYTLGENGVPNEQELVEQIQQRLHQSNEHPGRTARKPW